ncbi:MAG: ABC transporter substrate-binding protein [Lachnospiraceae bacterium]|nr:ABC transporter substrate-binding protein [Lachnospiraceae bacterium]
MKKILSLILTLAMVLGLLGGITCVAGAKDKEVKDILVIGINSNPQSLSMSDTKMQNEMLIGNALFDTLIYPADENGEFAPRLAASWEWEDGTHLIFHLRDDVYFHNGEKMTAEDVAFTVKTSCETLNNRSFFSAFDAENTEAIDETTVRIAFQYEFAPALAYLSSSRGGIICKSAYEEMGADAYNLAPVGTGQFKFVSWTQGDSIELERNDEYWNKDKIPSYSHIRYRIITENSVRAMEIEAGGIDMAYNISSNDFERLSANPNLMTIAEEGLSHQGFQLNSSVPELSDIRVREALCISLDTPSIVAAVYGQYGTAATGLFSNNVFAFDELGPYEYNPERAKELLAEAGYEDGFDITMSIADITNLVKMAEIAQQQWAQVGINLTINIMEQVAVTEQNATGQTRITTTDYTTSTADPGHALQIYRSTWNGALQLKDDYIDEMLDKGLQEFDTDKRAEIYKELQEYIWNYYTCIPLVFPKNMLVYSTDIENLVLPKSGYILDYSSFDIYA